MVTNDETVLASKYGRLLSMVVISSAPSGRSALHVGPLSRVEFDFIGKLRLDTEDDQFIGFEPTVEVFVIESPL